MTYQVTRLSDGEVHTAVDIKKTNDFVYIVLESGETPLLGFYKLDKQLQALLSNKLD